MFQAEIVKDRERVGMMQRDLHFFAMFCGTFSDNQKKTVRTASKAETMETIMTLSLPRSYRAVRRIFEESRVTVGAEERT